MKNRQEKYRAEAERLRTAGQALLDEADSLTIGKDNVEEEVREKAEGMYEEASGLFKRAETCKSRASEFADAVEKADEEKTLETRERNKWMDDVQHDGSPKTSDLNDLPTVDQLAVRSKHMERKRNGESYDDGIANQAWPQENLYAAVIRERVLGPDYAMTDEQREAWNAYKGVAVRALAPTQLAGTAGKGGEFVPETLLDRIYTAAELTGGFAGLSGIATFTQNDTGAFKVPTVTDFIDGTKKPARTAEGADRSLTEYTSGQVEIALSDFDLQVAVTDDILKSGNVSLEAFLVSRVGERFGAVINDKITDGTGTNEPLGISKATGRAAENTARAAITKADVTAFLKRLNGAYFGRPTSQVHMHFNTALDLAQLVDGNIRAYSVTADGRPILPGGANTVINNALQAAGGTASKPAMIVGDVSQYAFVTDGPMKFERARELRSRQWLLAWNMKIGGAPIVNEAFAVMTLKA